MESASTELNLRRGPHGRGKEACRGREAVSAFKYIAAAFAWLVAFLVLYVSVVYLWIWRSNTFTLNVTVNLNTCNQKSFILTFPRKIIHTCYQFMCFARCGTLISTISTASFLTIHLLSVQPPLLTNDSPSALRLCTYSVILWSHITLCRWCVPCLTRAGFTVLSVSSVLSGFFCGPRSVSPHHRAARYMFPHQWSELECERLKNATRRHMNQSWHVQWWPFFSACMSQTGSRI